MEFSLLHPQQSQPSQPLFVGKMLQSFHQPREPFQLVRVLAVLRSTEVDKELHGQSPQC